MWSLAQQNDELATRKGMTSMEKALESIQHEQWAKLQSVSPRLTRRAKDHLAGHTMGLLTLVIALIAPLMALALLVRAWPILSTKPLGELLLSTAWHPLKGAFGFFPFIMGTLWVTAVAMVIAVPLSLLTAIYLAEYAPARTRAMVKPFIELLAGIPSVVYGVWGMLTIVPFVEKSVAPFLNRWLGFIPLFRADNPTGYGVLAGSLVLAEMIFPIIIAVAEDVIRAVPHGLREASLALGATRWQTVKHVVMRQALPGVLAAVVLGFSRAFGETMAVLMVVGNVPQVPHSIFDSAYPLTALIANNYGEMMSIPLYDAALLGAALILLLVVLVFNVFARLALLRLVRGK
jgi:phosphate transport system permease protein